MADEKPIKSGQPASPQPAPSHEVPKGEELQLDKPEEHPTPVLHGQMAVPAEKKPSEERLTATYSGLGGFVRLAWFLLVRRVKLSGMKRTLSRLESERAAAFVELGRRALEMKLSHPEIGPLAAQVEPLDAEIAAKREEIRKIEAEPLSDDPQVRTAELNLRKVKISKINEAIQAIEAKCRPLLDEIGHIVHRYKLEPETLSEFYTRIRTTEAEIVNQERRIDETNAEYEAVSPGVRALAYGFWVVIIVIVLVVGGLALRGCTSGTQPVQKRADATPATTLHEVSIRG